MFFKHFFNLSLGLAAAVGLWGLGRKLRCTASISIPSTLLQVVYDFGIGALVCWKLMFLLGLLKLYKPLIGKGLLASSVLVALLELRNLWPQLKLAFNALKRLSWLDFVVSAFIACAVTTAVTGALTPPASQDALVHHLNLPKKLLAAGALVEYPYDYFSYFPAGMEMLYLYGMMLAGAEVATLLHTCFGVVTAVAIASGCSLMGLRQTTCLIAAAAYLTIPTVWMEMSWAYVDLALAFYVLLIALGLLLFRLEVNRSTIVAVAIAMAGALSIKYTALYAMVPLPLLLIVACRERKLSRTAILRSMLLVFLLAGIIASPWYIRNIVWTHNPFFPFFLKLFPSVNPGWDAERAALLLQVLNRYGGTEKTLIDYLITPWKLSFLAKYGSDKYYQGILGFFYFFGLCLLALTWTIREEARYLLVFAGTFYLFWLLSAQELRYLLPIFPVLCVAIASGRGLFEANGKRWLQIVAITMALSSYAYNSWHIAKLYREFRYFDVFVGNITKEEYLRSKFDYYAFYEYINSYLPKDSRIFLILASNQPYYLEREYFSDAVFEAYTIKQIVASSASPDEIRNKLVERGFTHLLYRPRLLFGEATTPFNEQETERFLRFLSSYCKIELIDERQTFALVAIG